jgi:predicted metal-dependent HD superfamily phosphohydrolase
MYTLASAFNDLLRARGVMPEQADQLWQEVLTAHSAPSRHYHTMQHLEDLHQQLTDVHRTLQDPEAVVLAIAYHDFVYSTARKDNEERSAEVMRDRMKKSGVTESLVERAAFHILATKQHGPSTDPDTDLFTDADLSILGASPERYRLYAEQVRREYRRYPDLLYKPGRRKVLAHFLAMPRIFKTPYFWRRYEDQARMNLNAELGRA